MVGLDSSEPVPEIKTVLVVDDDTDIVETLRTILKAFGIHAATARNGQEALTYIRNATHKPKLILLDLMMPVMNGWEFRDEQAKDPELASIPVALMSAASRAQETARELRADALLEKPLSIDRLLKTVAQFSK